MIVNIYSVYDEASKAYLPPMYFLTKGLAIRS